MDPNPGLTSCTNHTQKVIKDYTKFLKNIYSYTSNSNSKSKSKSKEYKEQKEQKN